MKGGFLLPYTWVNERTSVKVQELPHLELGFIYECEELLSEHQWIEYQENLHKLCKHDPCVASKHLIHADAGSRLRSVGVNENGI